MDFLGEGFSAYDAGDEEGVFVEVAGIGGSELVDEKQVCLSWGEIDIIWIISGKVREGIGDQAVERELLSACCHGCWF